MWPGVWTSVMRSAADLEHVARVVQREIGVRASGDTLHAERLRPLHVHLGRDVVARQERGDALDLVAHHLTADVVRVVVRREHAGESHPVGVEDRDELVDPVRGIDRHCFAGLTVTEQVHEVDHLPGDGIAAREVAPGEQLAEVEASRRWLPFLHTLLRVRRRLRP